jgi:hypothetical protein
MHDMIWPYISSTVVFSELYFENKICCEEVFITWNINVASRTDQRNNMITLRSLIGTTRNSTNLEVCVALQNISIATPTRNSTISAVAMIQPR